MSPAEDDWIWFLGLFVAGYMMGQAGVFDNLTSSTKTGE